MELKDVEQANRILQQMDAVQHALKISAPTEHVASQRIDLNALSNDGRRTILAVARANYEAQLANLEAQLRAL